MSTLVVDVTNLSTTKKQEVGERMKAYRKALELTQKEFFYRTGIPVPSLQDYEAGNRMPGGEAISALIDSGINANWLLTGDGTMLLADLAPTAAVLPPAKINIDALEALLVGALKIGRNSPPHLVAALCARLYGEAHDSGFITADGIGHGNMDEAC